MVSRFQVSLNNANPIVAPGARVELVVVVQNLSSRVDQVIVEQEGIDPAWVAIVPAQLPVFPQAQAAARLSIEPPNQPAVARAGLYPFRVRVIARESAGLERDVPATLDIRLVGECCLVLDQPERSEVRQASYAVRLKNGANAPVRLRLNASDPENALWYAWEPFEIEVPAGADAKATLLVQPRAAATAACRHTFTLRGEGVHQLRSGGEAPATVTQASGQLIQLPAPRLELEAIPAASGRASATAWLVLVSNPGLVPVTAHLTVEGEVSGLVWQFEPDQVEVAPQSRREFRLRVSASQPVGAGERLSRALRVVVTPEERDTAPVSTEITFVKPGPPAPTVAPERRWPTLIWWLAVALIVVVLLVELLTLGTR